MKTHEQLARELWLSDWEDEAIFMRRFVEAMDEARRTALERAAKRLEARAATHLNSAGTEYMDDFGPLIEEDAEIVRALIASPTESEA